MLSLASCSLFNCCLTVPRFLFNFGRFIIFISCLALSCALFAQTIVQGPEENAGETVYQQVCSTCHDNPAQTNSPAVASLRQMGPRAISYALTNGKMMTQAAALSSQQIGDVVGYLSTAADIDNSWITSNTCATDRQARSSGLPPTVGGYGFGLSNHRSMSAAEAGLNKQDMPNLELAWAMAFPQSANMRAQPAVVGNTLYQVIPDAGQLFALDIQAEPCVLWVYEHAVPLRSALQAVTLEDGREVLIFGDVAQSVQMLDLSTRELVWRSNVRVTSVSNVTAMPVYYDGRVYVSISSGELNMGAAPEYECCTSHGAVVALDVMTGERVWTYHTMEDAQRTTISRVGTQQWGPSGAPIWTTPAIDEVRGVLYVGTGQNTSVPATDTSDAVLAINLDDGTLAWKFQATENDIYLTGCSFQPDGPNCPPDYSANVDWDFGASMIIAKRQDGSDIILAGQKSGTLWALDPENNGALVWSTEVGPGGPLGGIHWGMAYMGEQVFAPVNQVGLAAEDPDRESGLHALNVDTGEILWSYYPTADCSGQREQEISICASNYGMSAATLLIDGAVVQGSNDGKIRVFDGANGNLLFSFDTARSFDTVNGVTGHGGSIDNASIVAANGMLLVQSGYGLLGAPGNVLLAFKVAQ